MTYRNDLDAALTQISTLREENAQLHMVIADDQPPVPTAELEAKQTGMYYEMPRTLWPMLDDWHEMVSFFSTPSSNSALEWLFSRIGFLAAIGFFTPCLLLISIPILPLVLLSGFKIGNRPVQS